MKSAMGIIEENNNQIIAIKDEKENDLIEGIETEQDIAVTDNMLKVSTVYQGRAQEATDKDKNDLK